MPCNLGIRIPLVDVSGDDGSLGWDSVNQIRNVNLRILVYLNPSNIDKTTHKFRLQGDSGFLLVKNSILALNKRQNWHFYLLVPDLECWPDKPKNVTLVPYPYVNDALNSRFHFDTNALCEYFNNYAHDIDLIWTMLPEQAGALRAFANKRREEIPIFSYINWWDYRSADKGYEPSYLWRLVDGFENSDLVGVQSEWMLECLKNDPRLAKNADLGKARVIPPKTHKTDIKGKSGYFIAFPHRISQESGFHEFMDLVRDRLKFKVWVSNLNNAPIENEPMVDSGMIESHDDYYTYLSKSRFGVSYHVGYSMWSMSVLDMMAVGKVVLVPNKSAFPEMFGNGYPFYFSNKEQFLDKFEYLQTCAQEELEMWGERNRMLAQKYFSWDKQAEDLEQIFLGLVAQGSEQGTHNPLVIGSNPIRPRTTKKTPSVLAKVKEFGKIYKTDLINKNITDFGRQCSRAWNKCRIEMMRDHGIMDDHESELTIFFTPENKDKAILARPEKVPTRFDLRSKAKPDLMPELF